MPLGSKCRFQITWADPKSHAFPPSQPPPTALDPLSEMGKNTASVARIAAFVAVPVVIVLVAALFTSRSTIAAVSNPEPEDLMEEIAAISSANKASPASTAAVSAAAAAIAKAATLNPEDVKDDYFVDEDTTEREHLETLPPTHVSSAVRLVRSKSLLRWARAHGASFNAELGVDEHGGRDRWVVCFIHKE